jgi:hypothetical protein
MTSFPYTFLESPSKEHVGVGKESIFCSYDVDSFFNGLVLSNMASSKRTSQSGISI